jgi:hypothetical protein
MGRVSDYIYPRVTAAYDSRPFVCSAVGLRIYSCTIIVALGMSVKKIQAPWPDLTMQYSLLKASCVIHSPLLHKYDV